MICPFCESTDVTKRHFNGGGHFKCNACGEVWSFKQQEIKQKEVGRNEA